MKNIRNSSTLQLLFKCLLATLTVAATTVPLFLIGRTVLGEGVIALIYLIPVAWSASRWGLVPGIIAALIATLFFDFLFIPPFFTFNVGSLEGWLILAIFLGIAIFVVERIQNSLSKAHEISLMYEFSTILSSQRTQEAISLAVAREIQQLFQASRVNVIYGPDKSVSSDAAIQSGSSEEKRKPDRILPILTTWGLVGEIQIWRGWTDLPSESSRLLQNFAWEAARALDRARPLEAEHYIKDQSPDVAA